jgi:hypothetical protein
MRSERPIVLEATWLHPPHLEEALGDGRFGIEAPGRNQEELPTHH